MWAIILILLCQLFAMFGGIAGMCYSFVEKSVVLFLVSFLITLFYGLGLINVISVVWGK